MATLTVARVSLSLKHVAATLTHEDKRIASAAVQDLSAVITVHPKTKKIAVRLLNYLNYHMHVRWEQGKKQSACD